MDGRLADRYSERSGAVTSGTKAVPPRITISVHRPSQWTQTRTFGLDVFLLMCVAAMLLLTFGG